MAGGVVMVVVLVVVIPLAVMMSGAVAAALLGWLVGRDVDASHEGSELIALSQADPYGTPTER